MITVILKKNQIFLELRKLLSREGVDLIKKKDWKDFRESKIRKGVLVVEIESEKNAKKVSLEAKNNLRNMEIICLLNKDYNVIESNYNLRIIYQPIVFNEFLKTILNSIKSLDSDKINSLLIKNLIYFPGDSKLFNKENSRTVKLTDLENKFLKFVIHKRDGVVKSEILKNVWMHNTYLETHTLESLIYRLRRKIETDPNNPRILVKIKKKYFLIR